MGLGLGRTVFGLDETGITADFALDSIDAEPVPNHHATTASRRALAPRVPVGQLRAGLPVALPGLFEQTEAGVLTQTHLCARVTARDRTGRPIGPIVHVGSVYN